MREYILVYKRHVELNVSSKQRPSFMASVSPHIYGHVRPCMPLHQPVRTFMLWLCCAVHHWLLQIDMRSAQCIAAKQEFNYHVCRACLGQSWTLWTKTQWCAPI